MFSLIPDLQRELGEYLSIEELEYLLSYEDVDLEYEVISSDKWLRYLAISKYNFTSLELDNFKEKPIFKSLLPLFSNNKIAAGSRHSLALDNQGKIYAWGRNEYGQLGLGDEEDRTIPTLIKSELTFRTIEAGRTNNLALDTQGKLYSWGENDYGQLGLCDLEEYRTIPTPVAPELTFRTIATRDFHSLALDTKGKLYAWGRNEYGQLGLSDKKDRIIPTPVAPELTFRTIAAGSYHSLALDITGKLYAWGNNMCAQLGLGDSGSSTNRTIPTLIKSELTFRTIAAGYSHSLALDNQGKLYAWGRNDYGQLGLNDRGHSTYRNIPTPVAPRLTFRTIAAGVDYSLALDTKGKLYAWGWNGFGQLGLGDRGHNTKRNIPTLIKTELTFRTIATEDSHSLALDTQGKLYAWGYNYSGQLGLGDEEDRTTPTLVDSRINF
jgi:alpha-tubulin suppressor-like RCC1 family protein